MAAERIIGVDFGTSTSVIRVKRYQDGRPVDNPLDTKPVTFNMGNTMVPTLIQKLPTGDAYFGHEAEIAHRNAKTFQNFKVDIENPDEGIRRQARELTAEFLQYLAKSYRAQSEGGHLGENDDRERTIISYPVKWSDETKAFMVQIARDAGFPNVEGVDEAQAAIQAVTVQNADLLTRKGYFKDGAPVNILLIDMGAGTTDLVLCRHTPGAQSQTDVLSTWPKGGNALFGGREVDELLRSYICRTMSEADAERVRKIAIKEYKAWKESTVSPALEKKETVDFFSFLNLLGVTAEFSISRDSFETYATDYLRQFPDLVRGCVSAAGLKGDDVDLVILTGGHSQWYFVREMLSGNLGRFGKIGLGKIQADPERIIPITLPQETVALGLVYGSLKINPPPPPPYDVFPLKYDPYSRIRPVIAAGRDHTVYLRHDGTVLAFGSNEQGQCDVNDWRDIVAVGAGDANTVGLRKGGTVITVGGNNYGQCNVNNWQDIVAIAVGSCHTVGLRRDGTVVAVGANFYGQCNVNYWRDIVAIAAGHDHTVGLKKDGTTVAVGGNSYGQCDVNYWRDIAAIAAGRDHTVGLRHDGTVIVDGKPIHPYAEKQALEQRLSSGIRKFKREYDYVFDNVGSWRDIVAIASGDKHIVGLKKDGTVIAVGQNKHLQCHVSNWRDVVAIAAGWRHTVGLKKDGTIVSAGI